MRCLPHLPLLAASLLTLALSSFSARAQEDAPLRSDNLPLACEFTLTFPEEPVMSRRCADAAGTDCYTALTFTRVYDLQTSVSVRASCNPVEPAMVARYTEDVMKKTLEAMARDKPVEKYTLNASERDWGRAATLFGQGTKGVTPTLYVGQIWIGKASVFTVEGELSGRAHPEADALFSEILKSIKPGAPPAADAAAPPTPEDKTTNTPPKP